MAIIFPVAYKVDTTALKNAEGQMAGFSGKVKEMLGPLAAVAAGFAAAFSVTKIVENSVKKFDELAGSVRGIQRVMGGTVESVSGLRGAMQLAGVPVDNLNTLMVRFAKNVSTADVVGSKVNKLFADMGVAGTDAHGKLLPMDQLLPALADKFAAMPAGAEKTAAAMTLFGRQGATILPFLNKGSAGIDELTAKAQTMGLVLDETSMKQFADAKVASREFNATLQGLQVTIGAALLPVIEAFQSFVRGVLTPAIFKVTAFLHDHRAAFEQVAATISSVLKPVMDGLSAFLTGTFLPGLRSTVDWVRQNSQALGILASAVVAGVVAWNGYKAVQGILAATTVFQQAYTAALFGGTLETEKNILAAKAGAAWYAIRNSTIVTGIAAWWANTAAQLANTEGGLLAKAAIIATSVATGIATAAQWAWNAAMSANPIGIIVVAVAALVAALVYFFTQTDLGKKMWKDFTKFLTDTMKNLGDFFGTVWQGISKAFTGVFDFISGAFKGYVNIWIGLLNFIIGALDTIQLKIPDWVPGIGGQTWGINIPKIPRLAEGGIVPATPGGRLVTVGEGGSAEAIIPLNKARLGGNTHNISVTVNAGMGANGTQIGKQIVDEIKKYERANGAVWTAA